MEAFGDVGLEMGGPVYAAELEALAGGVDDPAAGGEEGDVGLCGEGGGGEGEEGEGEGEEVGEGPLGW